MMSSLRRPGPAVVRAINDRSIYSDFARRGAAWSSFQQAYSVGRQEAGAALNLLKEVPQVIGDRLKALVEYLLLH